MLRFFDIRKYLINLILATFYLQVKVARQITVDLKCIVSFYIF